MSTAWAWTIGNLIIGFGLGLIFSFRIEWAWRLFKAKLELRRLAKAEATEEKRRLDAMVPWHHNCRHTIEDIWVTGLAGNNIAKGDLVKWKPQAEGTHWLERANPDPEPIAIKLPDLDGHALALLKDQINDAADRLIKKAQAHQRTSWSVVNMGGGGGGGAGGSRPRRRRPKPKRRKR